MQPFLSWEHGFRLLHLWAAELTFAAGNLLVWTDVASSLTLNQMGGLSTYILSSVTGSSCIKIKSFHNTFHLRTFRENAGLYIWDALLAKHVFCLWPVNIWSRFYMVAALLHWQWLFRTLSGKGIISHRFPPEYLFYGTVGDWTLDLLYLQCMQHYWPTVFSVSVSVCGWSSILFDLILFLF